MPWRWSQYADTALRLVWPVIAVQVFVVALLVGTGQGQDVVLSGTEPGWPEFFFLLSCSIFAFINWLLSRTIIDVTDTRLVRDARTELPLLANHPPHPTDHEVRVAKRIAFKFPCILCVGFLIVLYFWLITKTGDFSHFVGFVVAALLVLAVWNIRGSETKILRIHSIV